MRTTMRIKVRKVHAQCAVVAAALLTFVAYADSVTKAKVSPAVTRTAKINPAVVAINPAFMITPDVALAWNTFKSEGGPTYAGSPSGVRYANFLISTAQTLGLVDLDYVDIPYLWYQ